MLVIGSTYDMTFLSTNQHGALRSLSLVHTSLHLRCGEMLVVEFLRLHQLLLCGTALNLTWDAVNCVELRYIHRQRNTDAVEYKWSLTQGYSYTGRQWSVVAATQLDRPALKGISGPADRHWNDKLGHFVHNNRCSCNYFALERDFIEIV